MLRSLLLIIALTGCGEGFRSIAALPPGVSEFSRAGDGSLTPLTDQVRGDCTVGAEFDACIYQKNPVAQAGGFVSLGALEDERDFGVKIRGVTSGEFLENAKFKVLTLFTKRLRLARPQDFRAVWSVEQSYVEQLSTYYWAELALSYLENRLGPDRVNVRGLKIYADDAITGYVAATDAIHLQKPELQIPKALSGDVIVQLLGQAVAQRLSGGKLFPVELAQHNYCALDPKGCCASANGCAAALASGFGDYVAAMIFPRSPRIGESVAQSTQGQSLCGWRRDLASLSSRSRAEAYDICVEKGRAPLMGAWYAAKWWSLRQQWESQESGAGAQLDKLFFDHARAWTAATTFVEAKAEALRLAETYEGGKFRAALAAAL